jgi:membrane protease YdiL (CAAX protease family)
MTTMPRVVGPRSGGPVHAAGPWVRLLVVLALVFGAASLHAAAPFGVLLVLAVAWPPQVSWRPFAVGGTLLRYLVFAVVWVALAAGYLRLMAAVGHAIQPQPMLVQFATADMDPVDRLVVVLGVVFVAPLAEEILFRGYLYTALEATLPVAASQAITAVLFGLAHGLEHAAPIAALSLLFGYLRHRHGALGPCVLAHACHNGLTLAVVLSWPGFLDTFYGR